MAEDSRVNFWIAMGAIGSLLAGVAAVAGIFLMPLGRESRSQTERQSLTDASTGAATAQQAQSPQSENISVAQGQTRQTISQPVQTNPEPTTQPAPSTDINTALARAGVGLTRTSASQAVLNFQEPLLFEFGEDAVNVRFLSELQRAAGVLREHPDLAIEIDGHDDSVGPDIESQDISERRAMNVASVLIRNGVERGRIAVIGYGESRPIASNATDDGRARNRRVEVYISAVRG